MDTRNIIVSRIDLLLRRHLDQEVDTHRAVNDARYARDLLLVCDAMEGTELPALATQFRVAEELTLAARRNLSPRPPKPMPEPEAPMPPQTMAASLMRRMTFARAR